ncbi:phospholipase D family protein [Aliidiomarina celeris]|uniref:phospholipase D family protein n=1 Tax=Aliidiomarina celeris TaxID=2249428 RepID=UPI000DEAD3B5|nr:phospholipase D family protein [Aliidiomarina celeris]
MSIRNVFRGKRFIGGFIILVLIVATYNAYKPLPEGLNLSAEPRNVSAPEFLADVSFTLAEGKGEGERNVQQTIFDAIMQMIANAEQLIVLDMFLFNDFLGIESEASVHRGLSSELTEALIAQQRKYPTMHIQVISDPLNTLYGGAVSKHFAALEENGIHVSLTDLTELRDSNPLYSGMWRLLIKPFGNSTNGWLPNPFGEGRVSLRSYLALLNFKANHRKLLIADQQGQLTALVTSANPHDGSSAHGNVALKFGGQAAWDLLASEQAVLAFSDVNAHAQLNRFLASSGLQRKAVANEQMHDKPAQLQILTERAVEQALLALIEHARVGETLSMAVFYLSDRQVVNALKRAAKRGVDVRVLLDPNKDAFGREKNGVPNRPVAHELVQAGVAVRWCNTQGEQCHAKWVMHEGSEVSMLLGSTNFTRRNMHNLNLETSVLLTGAANEPALEAGRAWFNRQWQNTETHRYSVDYAVYADASVWSAMLYRWMEWSGLSTF